MNRPRENSPRSVYYDDARRVAQERAAHRCLSEGFHPADNPELFERYWREYLKETDTGKRDKVASRQAMKEALAKR